MDDSIPQRAGTTVWLDVPAWKTVLNWVAAVITSLLFIVAGLWDITDIPGGAAHLRQALVPEVLSLPGAILLGIGNTFAGVLVLVPRFRRWGAWLTSLMLTIFILYFAINYTALRGADCSCFPWIQRLVGPGFFISDGIMLGLAIIAGVWAKPSEGLRSAMVVLGAVTVFALVSWGVATTRQMHSKAPESITVDGKPFALRQGRVVLYFFNPECTHCLYAARELSKLQWGSTRVVGVPTEEYNFGQDFMKDSGLRGGLSPDGQVLRKAFPFVDPPFLVALENGSQQFSAASFETSKPFDELKKLGFAK